MVDMAHIIEQKEGKNFSAVAKILEPHKLKSALSPLAWKILQTLSQSPSYPKQIGKKLKVHEQKVYYHIRKLQNSTRPRILLVQFFSSPWSMRRKFSP